MCAPRMHDDQVDIDVDLVRRLLTQFPEWAELPLEYFDSGGTVNAIYRLGSEMYVRLPLSERFVRDIPREKKWLPRLAPHLPVPIPQVLATGKPGEGYPFEWGVYNWIEGEPWRIDRIADLNGAATDLARFIEALRHVDKTGGRPPGADYGALLRSQDAWVRMTAESARELIDAPALLSAWADTLGLPDFDGPAVWVHGDLLPGNVLVKDGRMHAVIDFAGVHLGDPAIDISAAWKLLDGESRRVFRAELDVDDETWARARGWAIPSVGAVHYYRHTNQAMVAFGLHTVKEVLIDVLNGSWKRSRRPK